MSPVLTVRLTSSSARTPGNSLVMERISRMGFMVRISCRSSGGVRGGAPLRRRGAPHVSLEVGVRVVAGVDQDLLNAVLGDGHRVQQVVRDNLLAVVVRLVVVDLGLLVSTDGLEIGRAHV